MIMFTLVLIAWVIVMLPPLWYLYKQSYTPLSPTKPTRRI